MAHQLGQVAADGEAEAGAALLAGVGGFNLLEAVEDGVELVGGNAPAFVGDLEQDGVGGSLGEDADGGGGLHIERAGRGGVAGSGWVIPPLPSNLCKVFET